MIEHAEEPPHLRLTGPADLLEAIPYLLGFHPRDSLALVGLTAAQRSTVSITARVDLADVSDSIDATLCAVARSGAGNLIAVVFTDDLPRARHAGEAVRHAADVLGLPVLDVLRVADDHWWSMVCDDLTCCPPEGRPLHHGSSLTAAAATFAGLVALPGRDDVVQILEPESTKIRHGLLPLLEAAENAAVRAILDGHGAKHTRSVKRAIFAAARDSDRTLFTGRLAQDRLARFAAGLADTGVRDAVWLAVDQGRLRGRNLWLQMARRVPAPYDAPPLFLFGWTEWRAGNGVLAGLAAERALASDTTYTAADLLLNALRHGLDPRRTPRLRMPKTA